MKKTIERQFMEALIEIEIVEFIGVARILKVNVLKEDNETPRNFVDVFSDMVDAFAKKNRTQKRELLKIVKTAAKSKKGDK